MLARPRFHLSFRAALACAALLGAGPPGCASADKCPPAAPPSTAPVSAAAPSAPAPVYRLEYELTSERPGGTPTSDSYALSVEEHREGTIRASENVPLSVGGPSPTVSAPIARIVVGFKVTSSFEVIGGALALHSAVELSRLADPPAIDLLTTKTTTLVTPGRKTQVAVLEETASHRKYTLAVTAVPSGAAPLAAAPSAGAAIYRLDYVLTPERSGGAQASASFALGVEDHGAGSLHVKTNMPVAPAARAEVGLGLKASVESAGDAISLHSVAELSVVADPPAIDKASADTTTVVTPGKETPVAVLEDAASHRKYRLAVTATKLR